MRHLAYIFLMVASAIYSNAQSPLFIKLQAAISKEIKGPVDNKLIALNVWSASDVASRNLNTEFEKATAVYGFAKLKGGSKGIIGVTFTSDNNSVSINITLQKDGIKKLISFTSADTEIANALGDRKPGYNVVFDKDGKIVYENLKENTVFESVHQLITR